MNILNKIFERKKEEVEVLKKTRTENSMIASPLFERQTVSMAQSVQSGSGIIAEFKKKSPSKPDIQLGADVTKIIPAYVNAGASGLSILTDSDYFDGSVDDILTVRNEVLIPILRKDFIVDHIQILESRSMGADCILLIAEILTKKEILDLAKYAHELAMEVILEVHTADQILKYNDHINIIGVNNRNLKTFITDINQSMELYSQLPSSAIKISESGIHHAHQAVALKEQGYDGFLIGEGFMKTDDAGQALADFISQMQTR